MLLQTRPSGWHRNLNLGGFVENLPRARATSLHFDFSVSPGHNAEGFSDLPSRAFQTNQVIVGQIPALLANQSQLDRDLQRDNFSPSGLWSSTLAGVENSL